MRAARPFRRLRRLPILWWTAVAATALITGSTVLAAVTKAEAAVDRYESVISVAVATQELTPGTAVSEGDFLIEERPKALLAASPPLLEPAGRVASSRILEGEVLVEADFGREGLSQAAALLAPGERAVAVPTTEARLSLRTGDLVDVVGSFQEGDDSPIALTLAFGARVIATTEDSVTLAMTEGEAPRVALGAGSGQIALLLSSPVADSP